MYVYGVALSGGFLLLFFVCLFVVYRSCLHFYFT